MKLFHTFIAIVILTGVLIWLLNIKPTPALSPISQSSPTPTSTPQSEEKRVSYNDQTYAYSIIQATPRQVTLIPNFSKREAAQTVLTANKCDNGVNGGFYDTNYRPLGYFRTDDQTLTKPTKNALLNGFFAIDQANKASIDTTESSSSSRIILQTGPLLLQNSEPLQLRIKNDEQARRMVAALTTNGDVVFIVLYNNESVFEGPLLGDVPSFISAISRQESLALTDAINLDGGSASVFYGDLVKLSELTTVGSLLCVQFVAQ